jgi:hypothetical protein
MTIDKRINAFNELGKRLQAPHEPETKKIIYEACQENPWFTPLSVRMALEGICHFLNTDTLKTWVSRYPLKSISEKTVGLVMAGNIPLVGFHDLLCVMISGHCSKIKLSTKDQTLLPFVFRMLCDIEPGFEKKVSYSAGQLREFNTVIATGSDNSSRYFEYYFGKYPNIIRRNRTSCAILSGNETLEDLEELGLDIFSYFGLGCRNVSKLFIPTGYSFEKLFKAWEKYKDVIHHHKYCNNYDYQKSILLINTVPFSDTGYVLLHENEKLVSPISVVYYEYYTNLVELESKIADITDKLQCIVGSNNMATVHFGKTQFPEVWDYADHIDTISFLSIRD